MWKVRRWVAQVHMTSGAESRLKVDTVWAVVFGLLVLTALVGVQAAWAAEPLPAAVQARVDSALQAYEAGRLQPARRAFERLAQQGVPVAQFNLAVMHLRKELPGSSSVLARRWLERSARAGFVTAQHDLGQALETGALGRRDLVQAHDWYALAATGGSVSAQVAMGTAHYLGRGRPQDGPQAAHWFREAAKAGDVGAMYLLASMYENGEGIATDRRLARYWYGAAAAQGDDAAAAKVKELDAASAAASS